MFSNKFENFSEVKLNDNNNIQIQNQNNHLSLENVLRNNNNKVYGVLNNNFSINYNNQFSPVLQIPNKNNMNSKNVNNNINDNQNKNQLSFCDNDENKGKKFTWNI